MLSSQHTKLLLVGYFLSNCINVVAFSFQSRPRSKGSTASTTTTRAEIKLRGGASDYVDGAAGQNIYEVNRNPNVDDPSKIKSHRLELDAEGRLQLNGNTIILGGLETPVWSATRPITHDDNIHSSAIFLHTRHSTKRAQHEVPMKLLTCNRFVACSRETRYWMGPKFGKRAKDIPLDTQFLLIELAENGPYALMLPLLDGEFRASLQSSRNQNQEHTVCLHCESGDSTVMKDGMRALYVAVGDDPFELLKTGFVHVSNATGTFKTLDQKTLPQSVNEFGWCTWDAFYSEVTPQGVLDGVTSLYNEGIPPRTIILDDGWQQVTPPPPHWTKCKDDKSQINSVTTNEKRASPISVILSAINAFIFKVFGDAIQLFYESVVRKAQHGSIANKIWGVLSRTILKGGMYEYFNNDTDFARQLSGFQPNHKFQESGGLKDLIAHLKGHLGVNKVYCWHALHGYWRGVSPELGQSLNINVTNVQPCPSRHLLCVEPQLEWDSVSLFGVGLVTSESDLAIFYDNLHSPLVDAGVDGVKVDVQSGVSAVGGLVGGGPQLARIYTEAMETSVSKHFGRVSDEGDDAINCINCMGHSTENLYRYKKTSIARASDDFYPLRPHSHTVHLVNVAYNSLFIGEICLPDWDMFHSLHESAGLHAAARAVGGCPIYVSDAPGKHDASILRKLVNPDGSVLRAKLPGRPTRDCLFTDVGKDGTSALKIWNCNSFGGVVGVFHVQGVAWNFKTHENEVLAKDPKPLITSVKPHDVESLRGVDGTFAAFSHQLSKIHVLNSGDSSIKVPLDHRGWDIFTVVPIQKIIGHDLISWAPIGLSNMLNSGGAILYAGKLEQPSASSDPAKIRAQVTIRGTGRFVAYCRPSPVRVCISKGGNSDVQFLHEASTGELSFFLPDEEIQNGPRELTIEWEQS